METQLVYLSSKSNPVTDSRKVAEKFGKRHDNVIRDIQEIITQVSDNQCKLKNEGTYFYETKQEIAMPNGGFRSERIYIMNYDGFTLLTMGFTGAKAMQFKLEYIAEFNRMK